MGGSEHILFDSTGDGQRSEQKTRAAELGVEKGIFTREEPLQRKDTVVSLAGSFPSYVLHFRKSILAGGVPRAKNNALPVLYGRDDAPSH